ncbi:MAG: hypothetical protein LBG76_04790 [Treponema sp.]|jgi:hypothetical protein|nr:hypothetical protein [Treponema sp.]
MNTLKKDGRGIRFGVCLVLLLAGILAGCENSFITGWYKRPEEKPGPEPVYQGTLKLKVLPIYGGNYELRGMRFTGADGQFVEARYIPSDAGSGQWGSDTPFSEPAEAEVFRVDGRSFYLPVGDEGAGNLVTLAIPIGGADELNAIRGGAEYPLNGRYIQVSDIDLASLPEWDPIGADEKPFSGKFDGGGYVIRNLQVTGSGGNSGDEDVRGLFGKIDEGSALMDIHVKNGAVSGNTCVGGICGKSFGDIFRCTFQGAVTGNTEVGGIVGMIGGAEVRECSFSGEVSGSGSIIGGIAGLTGNNAILRNCINRGNVRGVSQIGGVAGHAGKGKSVYINCENSGEARGDMRIGGIVGEFSSDGEMIIAANNTGTVYGRSEIGGIAGLLSGSSIAASTNRGTVTAAVDTAGGIVGYNLNGGITACYNTGKIESDGKAGGIIGNNEGEGSIAACYNNSPITGNGGTTGFHGWIIGDNHKGNSNFLYACYWYYDNHPTEINGVGTPPTRENAKPFGDGVELPADPWPTPDTHAEWGIWNGSNNGPWWKDLGAWDQTTPRFPTLYWE